MRGELAPSPPNTGVSHISPPLPNDVPYSSHRQWVGHSLGLLHQFAIPDFALFNSPSKKTAMRGGGVEPPCLAALDPKSSASASSATLAILSKPLPRLHLRGSGYFQFSGNYGDVSKMYPSIRSNGQPLPSYAWETGAHT